MTISRETYECERERMLRLIAVTRRIERGKLYAEPITDEINTGFRDHVRRGLVDLRYAYYVGMPQEGTDG